MTGVIKDENGLILPKKLHNPCIVSNSKRDIHREIKWNTDKGINVLNNKSELEIAFAKHKKCLHEKNKESAVNDNLDSEFQKMLKDRAKRLEQLEGEKSESENPPQEPVQKKNVVTKKESQQFPEKSYVIPSNCKPSPLRKHPALNTEDRGKRVADLSQDKAAESEFSRVYNQLRRDKQELVM